MNHSNYAISIYPDGKIIPARHMDNILVSSKQKIDEWFFLCPLSGQRLNATLRKELYYNLREHISKKQYWSTNHLPLAVKVNGKYYLYVSLDNSFRSNKHGFALKNRLGNICKLVRSCISTLGGECFVFFAESCGVSFDGIGETQSTRFFDPQENKPRIIKNEISWFEIRSKIENDIAY